MKDLLLLIPDPVRHDQDAMRLVLPDRDPIIIRNALGPLRAFDPGWHAVSLFTLLDPLWLLVLRHENGEIAWWHLDAEGALATMIEHRSEAERSIFRRRLEPLALWIGTAAFARIRVNVPSGILPQLRAFLGLPAAVQSVLATLLDETHASLMKLAKARIRLLDRWLKEKVPPIVIEASDDGRQLRLGNPDRLVTLMAGDLPARLNDDWEYMSLDAALAPMLSIVLRHSNGAEAVWFADLDGQRIGHHSSLLPPPFLHHAARIIEPLFRDLWKSFALDEGPMTIDTRTLIGTLSPRDLVGLTRTHLERHGEENTHVWVLEEPLPSGLGYTVPTKSGLRAFEIPMLERCLQPRLHQEMQRLLLDGHMLFPSPLDGRLLESDGFALMTDLLSSLYRVRDESIGLVFYVLCHGGDNSNVGLYFPSADLLVTLTRSIANGCVPFFRTKEIILSHLMRFGNDIIQGARVPRDPVIRKYFGSCALHVGHHVWQDIGGLTSLLRAIPDPDRLPPLDVFDDPSQTEFFGAIERIFPVFENRVSHHPGAFNDGLGTFYRHNQRVIRYTGKYIPIEMGPAVIAAAENQPGLSEVRKTADAARSRATPVILVGIRVGTRTLDDQEDFIGALLADLGRRFPGCTVVIDGLNDTRDRGRDVEAEPGSQLEEEFAVADGLARLSERLDVRLVDNINRSALASVLWASRADVFIAPLGAALAKYRWVCNTPGMILSSQWNLLYRADLHIYDAPEWMERPTELIFNPVNTVIDFGPERNGAAHPNWNNFIIERPIVFEMFADLASRHFLSRRSAKSEVVSQSRGGYSSSARLLAAN